MITKGQKSMIENTPNSPSPKKIRVVVCDDQPDIVDYISNILNAQSDLEVVGTANSGQEAVDTVNRLCPDVDVVLMDIQMETEYDGIKAIEEISANHPEIKCVMLTVHKSNELIIKAYLSGAIDYIVKTSSEEDICKSIRNSFTNDNYIGNLINENLRSEFRQMQSAQRSLLFVINELSKLTPSELSVMRGICMGMKQKEIANEKHIELSTVKFHTHNILKKLNFRNTKELCATLRHMGVYNIIGL